MADSLTCPACGAGLSAAPDAAGDNVPCPACGAPVPFPILLLDPGSEHEARTDPATLPRATRVSRRVRKGKSIWVTLAIFGGLFVFAGCAGVAGLGWALWPVIANNLNRPVGQPAGPGAGARVMVEPARLPFDVAIDGLKSAEPSQQRQALEYFARTPVEWSRRNDGAAALAAFPIDRHPEFDDLYLDALAEWAGTASADYVDAQVRKGGNTRERTVKLARLKIKLNDAPGAARMLAPLVFRGGPDPAADELLRKCHPGVEDVCREAAFDSDPAVRRRVLTTLAGLWGDGEPGALRKLYGWSFYDGLDIADPAMATAAVGWVREFHRTIAPLQESHLVEMADRLARLTVKQPPAGGVDPFAEYLAELLTKDTALPVVQVLSKRPITHPALAKVYVAAARFPTKPLALHLIAWLENPTVRPAAPEGLKALGRGVEPELRLGMKSGGPEQRARCRDLLVALLPPAGPGEVREPTL